MLELSVSVLVLLFFVAVFAGWVDVVAGGGGLITVPVLIMVGVPPATAVATNKLQGTAGTFSASWFFLSRGEIDLRTMRLPMVCVFLGSIFGSWTLLQIDSSKLLVFLPVLLLFIGLYYWFSPSMSDAARTARIGITSFAVGVCTVIGFYDGFLGPAAGSLFALAMVSLLGFGLPRATANAKLLNFTSNAASLIYFLAFGQIAWSAGLVMMAGQLIGARFGASSVLAHGSRLIKPMVVVVCFSMIIKLLFDQWANT